MWCIWGLVMISDPNWGNGISKPNWDWAGGLGFVIELCFIVMCAVENHETKATLCLDTGFISRSTQLIMSMPSCEIFRLIYCNYIIFETSELCWAELSSFGNFLIFVFVYHKYLSTFETYKHIFAISVHKNS